MGMKADAVEACATLNALTAASGRTRRHAPQLLGHTETMRIRVRCERHEPPVVRAELFETGDNGLKIGSTLGHLGLIESSKDERTYRPTDDNQASNRGESNFGGGTQRTISSREAQGRPLASVIHSRASSQPSGFAS